jgi:hypothetical protein
VIERLATWWFAPAPAKKLAALRIAVGSFALAYLVLRLPELAAVARLPAASFAQVGIARLLPAPLPPALVVAIGLAACALLAAFTAGVAYRVTAPLAALALLWTCTYRSSWGQLFHTEDLLVLHVIALACAPAADAWALARTPAQPAAAGYGWPIRLLAVLTCATYFVAGIAKLRLAGMGWLSGAQLGDQIAVDNLRKALLGDGTAPLASWMLGHPVVLAAGAVIALTVELAAPIALLGGKIARAWTVGAWLFHVVVVLTMWVVFPYPLLAVPFLPLIVLAP